MHSWSRSAGRCGCCRLTAASATVICVSSGTIEPSSIFHAVELRDCSKADAAKAKRNAESNFQKLHDRACATHAIATFLVDKPRNWKVPDAVRLEIARQMLNASVSASTHAIRYSEQNGISDFISSPWKDGPTFSRIFRLTTWLLFRNLLEAQARLGKRDDIEQTAVQFIRAVEAWCASLSQDASAPAQESQRQLRSAALHLIATQRAQLHQVRGEWAECAEQRLAVISSLTDQAGRSGLRPKWWQQIRRPHPYDPDRAGPPSSWELGLSLQIQLASEFAALSHARMQQPQTAESALLAVTDAQHAVALLHAAAGESTLLQLRAALDASARGAPAHTSARIGNVFYDQLISFPALYRSRLREAATPGLSPRGFFGRILELAALIEFAKMPQVRANARLTAVAAVYQQLGLALRAAGKEEEAQRACDFADEIAAMRPAVGGKRRSFKWHWFGLVVFVFPSLGVMVALHKLNEQRCVLPALHADDADYKRGGGCLSLCAQPLPPLAADSKLSVTWKELRDLFMQEDTSFSWATISVLWAFFVNEGNTVSLQRFVQDAAAFLPGGRSGRLSMAVFNQLFIVGDTAHNLATLLLDSPHHWKMSDAERLWLARLMLEISAQFSALSIRRSNEFHAIQGDMQFRNWHAAWPDRVLPTWALWTNLLNAQARLGLRDEFERTAARFSQTVDVRCNELAKKDQTAPDVRLLKWARAFALRLICEQRAQLHAVRGEWRQCAQQLVASVIAVEGHSVRVGPWKQSIPLGRFQTALPRTAELGLQAELAGKFAALSHARLQQFWPAPNTAVLDAQHAVALLTSSNAPGTLSEIAAAMRAEAAGAASVRIGAVPYSALLTEPALERVRQQQQQQEPAPRFLALRRLIPVRMERLCFLESLTVLQARSHARLSLVAAVYQQLGLALQAAGKKAEAQRAFDFADEMAAMRPVMRTEPRAEWMIAESSRESRLLRSRPAELPRRS